jgi:hypothetical protein
LLGSLVWGKSITGAASAKSCQKEDRNHHFDRAYRFHIPIVTPPHPVDKTRSPGEKPFQLCAKNEPSASVV